VALVAKREKEHVLISCEMRVISLLESQSTPSCRRFYRQEMFQVSFLLRRWKPVCEREPERILIRPPSDRRSREIKVCVLGPQEADHFPKKSQEQKLWNRRGLYSKRGEVGRIRRTKVQIACRHNCAPRQRCLFSRRHTDWYVFNTRKYLINTNTRRKMLITSCLQVSVCEVDFSPSPFV